MILQSITRVCLDPTTEHDIIQQMEKNVEWYKIIESTVAVVFEQRQDMVFDALKGGDME